PQEFANWRRFASGAEELVAHVFENIGSAFHAYFPAQDGIFVFDAENAVVADGAEGIGSKRKIAGFKDKVENAVFRDVFRVKNSVLHVRVVDGTLFAEEMDHFHRIATLPEKMAQVAVGADLFAHGFAEPQQGAWIVNDKVWMHLKRDAVNTVFTRKFRRFFPVGNDLFVPLPLQHGVVFRRPTVRDPVWLSIRGRTTRTPGEADDHLDANALGQKYGLLKGFPVRCGVFGIRVHGIPMAAQRGDGNSAVLKFLQPRFRFCWIGNQFIQRALPGVWIASRADLHGLEAEGADFVEHGIDGEIFVNVRVEHTDGDLALVPARNLWNARRFGGQMGSGTHEGRCYGESSSKHAATAGGKKLSTIQNLF